MTKIYSAKKTKKTKKANPLNRQLIGVRQRRRNSNDPDVPPHFFIPSTVLVLFFHFQSKHFVQNETAFIQSISVHIGE